jgi:hypothetical protein
MEVMTAHLDRYIEPRVVLTPAEHIASRRSAVETRLAAKDALTQLH